MSYNTFGFDERTRLLIAREHEAELREAWRMANGTSRRPEPEPEEPCSERREHALALSVARLFAGLRRRPRIAVADPCR